MTGRDTYCPVTGLEAGYYAEQAGMQAYGVTRLEAGWYAGQAGGVTGLEGGT